MCKKENPLHSLDFVCRLVRYQWRECKMFGEKIYQQAKILNWRWVRAKNVLQKVVHSSKLKLKFLFEWQTKIWIVLGHNGITNTYNYTHHEYHPFSHPLVVIHFFSSSATTTSILPRFEISDVQTSSTLCFESEQQSSISEHNCDTNCDTKSNKPIQQL